MPSSSATIAALQARFAEALTRPDLAPPADIVAYPEAQRLKRFNVYRNTVHHSLASALAARFPVVERIVGEEFFRAMALAFIDRHPPSSPVLAFYGVEFAAFLEGFEPVEDMPYLADVARIEWLRTIAYHAADCEPIAISALAEIAPEALDDVTFSLTPAAFVMSSRFPVFSIWRTNTHDETVDRILMQDNPEGALVTRPQLDVLVTPITGAEAIFVEQLASGASLGAAFRDASSADLLFDLSHCLARLFASGAVAAIKAPLTSAKF